MVTQLTAAMKRCFAAPSIFQSTMFCNVNALVLQLLLTLPVGSCSCEAVGLSFSCLRRVKTCSKEGRRVCGKGTTFTVLWTNQTLSLCLLCFATLAAMTAVCEIFNLIHLRSMAQGGHGPSGPMVNTPMPDTRSRNRLHNFNARFRRRFFLCNSNVVDCLWASKAVNDVRAAPHGPSL